MLSNCAQLSHPPTHWHAETCHKPGRGPSVSFSAPSHLLAQESRLTVLHCAHRTSTVVSCVFCEQEGRSGGSLSLPSKFACLSLHRAAWLILECARRTRANSSPAFSEAAGVVSIARIERPQLFRGGSASTETIPAVSPLLFQARSCSYF